MAKNIAIIGATGVLGHEIMNVLAEAGLEIGSLYALTGKRQAGRDISFGDIDLKTISMDEFDYSQVDVVFVTDFAKEAKPLIQEIVNKGVHVVDCTSVTLFENITGEGQLVTLPGAATLLLKEAVSSLHDEAKIKRIVVTTFEATSGVGKDGMDELFNQSRKFFVSDAMENHAFTKQISFNVIPQIDGFMDDGQTDAEWRMATQVKKCLDKDIKLTASCVQVPVFIGHGMAVNVEFENDIDAKTARQLWRENEKTVVIDESSEMEFVTPAEIAGEDHVYISRIREDVTVDSGLSFWCAGDNIRFAALEAVNSIF